MIAGHEQVSDGEIMLAKMLPSRLVPIPRWISTAINVIPPLPVDNKVREG